MKLDLNQLEAHLLKNCASIYLIYSSEFYLVQEACDLIKQKCSEDDECEKSFYKVDGNTPWQDLSTSFACGSLFSTRKVVHFYLGDGQISQTISKKFIACLEELNLIPDLTIIISYLKINKQFEGTKLFKFCDSTGISIPIWPMQVNMLPQWINRRADKLHISFTADAVKYLIYKNEGNLLALSQEIEKLSLLYSGRIELQHLKRSVAQNKEFSLYDLQDAMLAGNATRSLDILEVLLQNKVELVLISWIFTDTLKTLLKLKQGQESNTPLPSLYQKHRIWPKKQSLYNAALARLNKNNINSMLLVMQKCDSMVKQGNHLAIKLMQSNLVNITANKQIIC